MTAHPHPSTDPHQPRTPLATRATPPRPRRLSRKAIAVICGAGAFGVAGALAWGLNDGHRRVVSREAVSVERRQTDLLASAPHDYSDVARQAAGNLGPPSKRASTESLAPNSSDLSSTSQSRSGVDAVDERHRQQAESARASRLFVGDRTRSGPLVEASATASEPVPPKAAMPASGKAPDRRRAFLSEGAPMPTANSGRLIPPAGRYVVTAGSTIAAALVTGLSSDLPGQVVAQVTENVFDSATGRIRLIPQGTRLLGTYNAHVSYGQNRALVVWTRMILPDGRSLDLDQFVGTDASGQSGFADRVDNHWGAIVRAGLLATLLGVGTEMGGIGDDDAIADAIRDSAGQTVGRAGDRIVERELQVRPTITVRPGARVRVLISRDIILPAWMDHER